MTLITQLHNFQVPDSYPPEEAGIGIKETATPEEA